MPETVTLTGTSHEWTLYDKSRKFGVVTVPYRVARDCVMPVRFNGLTGKGQQREIVESHLRKIKGAMESGAYTPTPGAANLSKKHRESLSIKEDGTFTLSVKQDDPLQLTDAGHRLEALDRLVKELENDINNEKSDKQKSKYERWLKQAMSAPVSLTLYFDGDSQSDFLNLQCGRPVDAAHMLSLKLHNNQTDTPANRLAFEIAKLLNRQEGSPFQNAIRFDSRGAAALPINSLCPTGSSDIGTSLIGLARVGLSDAKPIEATSLAFSVQAAYKALKTTGDNGVLAYGKVLTPIANGGKKGSSTMLVGVGVCLAYRCKVLGHDLPTQEDLDKLVAAAQQTLDVAVAGNFSGPTKRKHLGEFAKAFFADIEQEKHEGVPVGLVTTLSASTFGLSALPKEKKPQPQAPEPIPTNNTEEEVQG